MKVGWAAGNEPSEGRWITLPTGSDDSTHQPHRRTVNVPSSTAATAHPRQPATDDRAAAAQSVDRSGFTRVRSRTAQPTRSTASTYRADTPQPRRPAVVASHDPGTVPNPCHRDATSVDRPCPGPPEATPTAATVPPGTAAAFRARRRTLTVPRPNRAQPSTAA